MCQDLTIINNKVSMGVIPIRIRAKDGGTISTIRTMDGGTIRTTCHRIKLANR